MHEDVDPLTPRTPETAGPVPAGEAAREPAQAPPGAAPETGNAAVDEVLRSLDRLGSRPLSEHVAVFESAHERLRAALSGSGDAAAGPGLS